MMLGLPSVSESPPWLLGCLCVQINATTPWMDESEAENGRTRPLAGPRVRPSIRSTEVNALDWNPGPHCETITETLSCCTVFRLVVKKPMGDMFR